MNFKEKWDWETEEKCLADLTKINKQYDVVLEPVLSPDGEKIAFPVKASEDEWTLCVNEESWPTVFDRIWYPKFSPNNRLTALVQADDMWNVAVDGEKWDGEYDYVWNTIFSPDGEHIAAQIKREGQFYSVLVDGKPWTSNFKSIRELIIDNQANVAAAAQIEPLKEADTFGFLDGVWSVVVNEQVWENKFVNVYRPIFNSDGSHAASEVRLDICEYTIAEDGVPWQERFSCVWEAIYSNDGSLFAPVKTKGGWTMAKDGKLLWTKRYVQLWSPKLSPDGTKLATIASPSFGKWTISVDDSPWPSVFGDAVLEPFFSPDGKRIAAIVKDQNSWSIAVDGNAWNEWFEMVWNPLFSPEGDHVLTKVERAGKYTIAVDGKVWDKWFDQLWDPHFSPDGSKILVKAVDNGNYYRRLVPVSIVS